jgi:hypothetical protein
MAILPSFTCILTHTVCNGILTASDKHVHTSDILNLHQLQGSDVPPTGMNFKTAVTNIFDVFFMHCVTEAQLNQSWDS